MPIEWNGAPTTRWERLQLLTEEAQKALADCHKECAEHTVLRTQRAIVLRSLESDDVTVPLLLTEVGYSFPEQGNSIIAVARPVVDGTEGERGQDLAFNVWLLVAPCDEVGLRCLLNVLSEAGAVRGDLREHFEFSESPFSTGSTAQVFKVRRIPDHEDGKQFPLLAAKVMNVSKPKHLAKIDREAELLAHCQGHPSIASFRGIFFCAEWPGSEEEDRPQLARQILITDLYSGGTLQSCVKQRGAYVECEALDMVGSLLSALAHIHGRGVVHRDVSAANVLLGAAGQPVLADFGIAAFLSDSEAMRRRSGTPGYVAPEVVMDGVPVGKKVDVFSAGIVLYFSIIASTPFASGAADVDEVYKRTIDCNVSFPPHRAVTSRMKRCILMLLTKDPEDRPTANMAIDVLALVQEVNCRADVVGRTQSERTRPNPLYAALDSVVKAEGQPKSARAAPKLLAPAAADAFPTAQDRPSAHLQRFSPTTHAWEPPEGSARESGTRKSRSFFASSVSSHSSSSSGHWRGGLLPAFGRQVSPASEAGTPRRDQTYFAVGVDEALAGSARAGSLGGGSPGGGSPQRSGHCFFRLGSKSSRVSSESAGNSSGSTTASQFLPRFLQRRNSVSNV